MTESAGLKTLFENAAHQQLANLIDRVTYIATNELYLPASEVPLSHPLASSEGTKLASPCISRSTMGALLEQQIEALQSSKWKPTTREAVKAVLSGALSLYNGQETPVRRARVLVKCLAYAYHEDPDTLRTTGYLGHQISDLLAEVQTLLAYEVSCYGIRLGLAGT